MPTPQILVVAPPAIQTPKGPMAPKFEGGEKKCQGLAAAYREICKEAGCHFFDAGSIITSSQIDGVHLDAEQHRVLGAELSGIVRSLLADKPL
jgi:lysophospholipase L1-like esterase